MNIAEILKDAPKGTKLYSPIYGTMLFRAICTDQFIGHYINVEKEGCTHHFTQDGKYIGLHKDYDNAECMLFPTKENRDWSTFKIEPQFPTSIDKCGEVLDLNVDAEDWYKESELNALRKLLIARDAWCKVDDDWKPDWGALSEEKFVICNIQDEIVTERVSYSTPILAFRTPELRDKFLETYRDLIEKCKELI